MKGHSDFFQLKQKNVNPEKLEYQHQRLEVFQKLFRQKLTRLSTFYSDKKTWLNAYKLHILQNSVHF